MTRSIFITVILLLTAAACTSTPSPLPASPTPAPVTPTFLPTNTPGCETHTASVVLSASPKDPRVGDIVTIIVKLNNEGCVALGLPQYRLTIKSEGADLIFNPEDPEPVVHSLGMAPGESDSAEFELEAVASGQATFTASVSFEVHLGYPGPAYWGSSSGGPLELIIVP